jgi:hypothetical protein
MKIEIHAAQHEKPGQVLNRIRELFAAEGWDIFIADPPTPEVIREAAHKLAGKARPLLIKVYRTTGGDHAAS